MTAAPALDWESASGCALLEAWAHDLTADVDFINDLCCIIGSTMEEAQLCDLLQDMRLFRPP